MKILYFCNERLDAQNLATALRSIAKNGTVSWTSSLDRAARWLDENKDVAALVVEAQADGATGASVLKYVRSLALRPAVVVIVPEGAGTRLGPLAAAADDLIDKNSARFRDLPEIVTRAVARLRGSEQPRSQLTTSAVQAPAVPPTEATPAGVAPAPESEQRAADLERKLAQAKTALLEAERRHQAAMATASEQLAERQVKDDLATAGSTARWQMVDEQLRAAAIEAESARQSQAAAAAELDRLTRRESELTTQLADAAARHDALAQRLTAAEAAIEAAHTCAEKEQAAAAAQLATRQRELQTQIALEVKERRTLDATLAQTVRDRDDAEARHAVAIANAAARLRELDAALRQSRDGNDTLTHRLADADRALEAAHAHAAREQLAAAEQLAARQRELQSQIATETERCRTTEATLAQAVRARDEAETRRAAAMMDAAAQLRELDAALRLSRDDQASTAAEVERLTAREADLSATLASVTANHHTIERRLAATEAAFKDADTRATSERLEVTRRAAAREAELDGQIRQERAKSASLEKAVEKAEAARREAGQQHESAQATAARELAEHQTRLAQTATDRDRLTQKLTDIEGALEQSRAEHRSAATEVGQLTQRAADLASQVAGVSSQLADVRAAREKLEVELTDAGTAIQQANAREAELEERIRQESAARARFEQAVADGEAALRDGRQQHDAAMTKAARELAKRQAQFDRERSETVTERDQLTARLADVEDALERVRSDYQSATAAVARLTEREADLVSGIADVQSARETLELQLAEAIENAAVRQAALGEQIRQENATRSGLEQALADAESARRDDQTRHDATLAAAANELAEHQARFDRDRSEMIADRNRVNQRLSGVERALERERTDHQAARTNVAQLTEREADLTSQLADVRAARQSVEGELAEALKAIADANEQAARDRAQAAARAADLDARLAREIDARNTLAQVLDETRAAALAAEQSFQQQAEGLRTAAREQKATVEAQLAQRRAEYESRLVEMQTHNGALALERIHLQQSLAAAEGHSVHLDADLRAAREQFEQARAAAKANIEQITAALEESGRVLEKERHDFQLTLERRNGEHLAVLDARHGEIQHLHDKIAATVHELQATRRTLEDTRAEADKLPPLRTELEESRSESARLFQQAGLAMFRCTRRGDLMQTNRAGMALVGRRTFDELRGTHFAAAVFEDPNGLSWLIERCRSTRTRESIETTWRRKDGGRLFVRLSAYATSVDVIEIVAEDLTRVRVLQERLGQAQRMEAVGRLASEVAVTCGTLLGDVHHDVQEWLVSAGGSASTRQQGEHLLAELTRAAGFLRQLAAYGEEQARTPALADLNTVIRDLEPVLKRVAGESVDVHVSDASSRLNVDVGTERIERLLVNLASFGRARMPHGGQLKIELGTTVVDRRFVAKHPNVRLGPHALITVTESRHTRKTDGLLQLRDTNAAARPSEKPDQKPGMDFGTLQGLVGGCGGHLWMTVQPQGDMVAKIHLPLLTTFDAAAPRGQAIRAVRERALARLFHH